MIKYVLYLLGDSYKLISGEYYPSELSDKYPVSKLDIDEVHVVSDDFFFHNFSVGKIVYLDDEWSQEPRDFIGDVLMDVFK